ncbi:hypothetical protein ACN28S_57625 [Cystobacter fuscus]
MPLVVHPHFHRRRTGVTAHTEVVVSELARTSETRALGRHRRRTCRASPGASCGGASARSPLSGTRTATTRCSSACCCGC